ncbi:MAG: AAA family ATPase [Chitinophagales bacterium]|nr:AAA family ATPase [Bacteroidota bacterium]MCB9043311.1 AAA family ATPase [Chitinophagales bacterium]
MLDPYGDFIEAKYFQHAFDVAPSELKLEIPLEVNVQNMNWVLGELVSSGAFKVVKESWKVSRNSDAKPESDFVNYYFLQSTTFPVCLHILLEGEEVSVTYYYDNAVPDATQFVQASFRQIREKLGFRSSPVFKVLSQSGGGFHVEEININRISLELEKNYNDDFGAIHQLIDNALSEDKSGLVLLHGKPGTGKTTYIKYLLSTHLDKNFIFIPNDYVNELLHPEFISFIIAHKNSILVIEDAEKVIMSRENENRNSVVSTILQLTDGLFSDYLNIKIICTFNTSIHNIDNALLRKGRLIAFYEFKNLSVAKTNALLQSLGFEKLNRALSVSDIYNYTAANFNPNSENAIGF